MLRQRAHERERKRLAQLLRRACSLLNPFARSCASSLGKPGHETPVFSGDMETVVFSPYWNVPDSIAEGETAPAAAKRSQLPVRESNRRHSARTRNQARTVVDQSDVSIGSTRTTSSQLSFRQRPGAKNALGHVKFLFPNAFNVYLHDTPADALFAPARDERSAMAVSAWNNLRRSQRTSCAIVPSGRPSASSRRWMPASRNT